MISKTNNIYVFKNDIKNIINKISTPINKFNINFRGGGNKIFIDQDLINNNLNVYRNINITCNKNDNNIIIHNSNFPININILCNNNSILEINKNLLSWGLKIHIFEKSKVCIGDNCVFAEGNTILPSDGHPIFDNKSIRINKSEDITIGNHCWIGRNSCFLKGSEILDDTIVGFGSIVTRKFNVKNILIAGNPAKIIKKDVYWRL